MEFRHSAPAGNKPHPVEKSTPVWLAIWRTWAGFANSQHWYAAFATPNNICAHSSLLPHWAAAQTDANLSAHLHRLPTPPPYLRRMRLLPGWGAGIGFQMMLLLGRDAGVGCWIWLQLGRCGVPANHLPRWVPPYALLARGSVDGATNLCSPSTTAKVNCLVIRYLHFGSVRGDLQEG